MTRDFATRIRLSPVHAMNDKRVEVGASHMGISGSCLGDQCFCPAGIVSATITPPFSIQPAEEMVSFKPRLTRIFGMRSCHSLTIHAPDGTRRNFANPS